MPRGQYERKKKEAEQAAPIAPPPGGLRFNVGFNVYDSTGERRYFTIEGAPDLGSLLAVVDESERELIERGYTLLAVIPPNMANVVLCEIHNEPMEKYERGGDVWYSHKLAPGEFCRGSEQQHKSLWGGRGKRGK